MRLKHVPVLLKETLEYLDPKPGENFIDCTFGNGGHAGKILEKIRPKGKLLGVDLDENEIIKDYKQKYKNRFVFIKDNFRNLKTIYERNFSYAVSGILCDLGISSVELDDVERGFSFRQNGPLDMRLDVKGQKLTAAEVLNKYSSDRLISIFLDFGEVDRRLVKKVVKEILRRRALSPFKTTFDLVEVILKMRFPRAFETGKINVETKYFYRQGRRIIHPTTKFFQALRIEVNGELDNLKEMLKEAKEIISPGGRIAVISFHSLEDRIVKNYFRAWAREENSEFELLTKKPVVPSDDEAQENPRARSGKLRVIKRKK